MKQIKTNFQISAKPLINITTKNDKKLVHFYLTKDIEPAWKDSIKVEEIETNPELCDKCGCLVSPTVKNIHTKYGYSVSYICPNCGLSSFAE